MVDSRLRFAVKLILINLSVFLFGLLSLELAAYGYYTVRKATLPDPIAAYVNSIPADAYEDRSWLMAGFHEFEAGNMRWEPFAYYRRAPFAGRYVNVDADGLRHTWNMPAIRPVKIFVFGGSTAFGYGARDDYTIPSDLSKLLAETFPSRIQVANYGTASYVSTQEVITLIRELQRGNKPDIAVFYDGYNDTSSALQQQVAGNADNEFNRVAEFNILNQGRSRDLYLEVLKRSNLYNLLEGIHAKLSGGGSESAGKLSVSELWLRQLDPQKQAALAADVVRVYQINHLAVEAIGDKMNFTPLFYWQPTPYTKDHLNDFEKTCSDLPVFAHFFDQVYAAIKSSPLAADHSFHDISDVLDGHRRTLYIDYAHTTEYANAIIAHRMFRDVLPLVTGGVASLGR
jgi:hypothetical protein